MKININMKKSGMKQRKEMALLFAGILMFTAITSGCGKKDIDYDSVQQEETTQTGLMQMATVERFLPVMIYRNPVIR